MNSILRHSLLFFAFVFVCIHFSICQVFPVRSGQKWGLIDGSGKLVLHPEFDALIPAAGGNTLVVKAGIYGLADSLGKIFIEPRYTFMRMQRETIVLINQGGDCNTGNCEGGKWGMIHLPSQNMIPPSYDLLAEFDEEGKALVNVGGKCGYSDCEGGRWGMIDTAANVILSPVWKTIKQSGQGELYLEGDKGWGLFSLTENTMLLPASFTKLKRVTSTRISVQYGELWGLLNNAGDTVLAPSFEGFADAKQGFLAYKSGERFGLMDSMGRVISAPAHDWIIADDFGWVRIRSNNAWGLIDSSGKAIYEAHLSAIVELRPGFAAVKRGLYWGVIDRNGKEIVPIRFETCTVATDSLFLVKDKKFHKWIGLDGKTVKGYAFQHLDDFENRAARAKIDDRWGLLNIEGNWIIKPEYDEVRVFMHTAKGRKGEEWTFFYFDDMGHPSDVRRIILIKKDGQEYAANSAPQISNAAGWFYSGAKQRWGLRNLETNRSMIEPKYLLTQIVPNSNLSLVMGKIRDSENTGWGMVDHQTGKELLEPLFEQICFGDFATQGLARGIYAGSGKYVLIQQDGQVINVGNASFIGEFKEKMARVNVGGRLEWLDNPGMDTLKSESVFDRSRNDFKVRYLFCNGGKWGYIDETGKWLHEVEYQSALDWSQGVARVKIEGKWGAIDKGFKVVVEPAYDFIDYLSAGDGKTVMAVGTEKPAYGFINERGEIVVRPVFEDVGGYRGGIVRIRQDGKWGYADSSGSILIKPAYFEAGDFHEGRARVRNSRNWSFVDESGSPISADTYLRAGEFHEGLAWVQKDKFFGFIGQHGELRIPAEFSLVGDFSWGLAPARRKGKFGLIDKQGRWVVQPRYYRIGEFKDGLAVIQEKGEFGLINAEGEFVVKPIYSEIADFQEGLARFRSGNNFGYLDHNGKICIPAQFANAADFSGGRAAVFHQGRWGFIDTTGKIAVEPRFAKVSGFHEGRAAVRSGDKWGYIDPDGRMVVSDSYDQAADFSNGRAAVHRKGLGWGLLNADGTLMVPCQYETAKPGQNGVFAVRKDRRWGLINGYGAILTPFKYDDIGSYHEGKASVLLRRSIGVVDTKGQVILPPKFDAVRLAGDWIMVEAGDAMGYINLNGEWVWELGK